MFFRLFIIFLFLWGSAPAIAEAARLNFGAAPGTTLGVDSEQQARRLAAELAEELDSEMSLRLFADQQQIGRWLNDFAMLDLGIMDAEFLATHPGEFLVLGSLDQAGRMFVVARQGAIGDMPKQVAAALRRSSGAKASARLPDAPEKATLSVDRQPAVSLPVADAMTSPLVLGLVAGPDALVRDAADADRFAAELGERLGASVRPRLFDSETALADWFLRFRVVDLAVIGEPVRRDPLVGDYHLLQRLVATGGAPVLLVARRDLTEDRLQAFTSALGGERRDLAAVPAAPAIAPPPVVAIPEPMVPSPPVWPVVPDVPAALPVPTLPPLPDLPVAPALAVGLAVPAESPETPAAVVPEQVTEDFQMPAAAPPVMEDPALLADLPLAAAPLSAAPVAAVPVVVAPVEQSPIVEAPVAVVPVPPAVPELPFTPVPPREVAEEPSSPPPVVESHPERPVVVAPAIEPPPVVEMPVAVALVAPLPVGVESAPEAIPDLPFVPVPPRTIEETPTPVRVVDEVVSAVVVGEVAVQETPAVVPEDSPWILSGAGEVPAVIAQPDLPQELRPPGVPLPRPGRLPKLSPPSEEPVLLAKLQEPLARTLKPPPLLPAADPEPGVIYVLPFISLMVPAEVQERVFDQFVDVLNQRGAAQKLKFVIVKQGLDKTDRAWLAARKHVVGEIYGYVEESGCCSTDLRTRVRLTYYRAHQTEPALKYEYPVRTFFDHDRSTVVVERQKLADQIAAVLVEEMFKALPP